MNLKNWDEIVGLVNLRTSLKGIVDAGCIIVHADGHNKKEHNVSLNGAWADVTDYAEGEKERIHGSMLRCHDSIKIGIKVWIEEIEAKLRKLGVSIDAG